MIKKQDLILKINKILNKLNKDKLINFYNIFINKKGGSLRNLCYHLNTDLDKEVKEKRATLQDAKITIPPRYSLIPRNLLIEFTKDIKIITTILKKNMIEKYDTLKTKNQELKYKFVCYTYYMHDDIRKLDINHFDLISDFMEFYLNDNKDKKKYTISKIGNSNKLRVKTENGISIDIIYTKDYQRINLVMYLEEISEKKRKEIFDQFDECYYSPQQLQQQFTTTNQYQYRPYNFGQLRPALKASFQPNDQYDQYDKYLLSRVGQQQGQQQATTYAPATTYATTIFRFGGPEKEFEDEIKKIQDYLKSFTTQTSNKKKYSADYDELKKQFDILLGIDRKISNISKDKTAVDIDKLRKLYDTLYNNFIDYLFSKYLYQLKLIIDDDIKNKSEKSELFVSLNDKLVLFHIDEDIVENNKIYLQYKKERKNFEKFLTDTKIYDNYDDKDDIVLISLIVEYYLMYKRGYPIKYKFYLALFKFIKNNYKLYELYNELKQKYDALNKLLNVEKGLIVGEYRPPIELQKEYNTYNDDIIDILIKIGDIFKELFGFNEPNLEPAISDVQTFKESIKELINSLITKKYKYNKLINIFKSIINKINRRIITNPQD
jgi:hypothetical protein